MSCKDCEEFQKDKLVAYYRWKTANVAFSGCRKHMKEIFDVLNDYQKLNKETKEKKE